MEIKTSFQTGVVMCILRLISSIEMFYNTMINLCKVNEGAKIRFKIRKHLYMINVYKT